MAGVNLDRVREKMKKIEEEKANRKSGSGDKKFYPIQAGKNTLRIMPPFNDDGDFYVEGGYHHNVGPDKKSVACPKTFGKGKCPICTIVDDLFRGDAADKNLARAIKVRKRYFFNAFVPGADETEYDGKKVFILPVPKTVFDAVISTIADTDWGDITHPKNGHNCTITKTGKELDTEYSVVFSPKATPIDRALLEEMYDLNEEFDAAMPTQEELKKILTGAASEDDDDEKPKKKKPKPKDEDDDEEEEAPPVKSVKKTKKPEPEPEPDDEDQPECFGEHEDGEDICLQCEQEDACAKATKKGKSRKSAR